MTVENVILILILVKSKEKPETIVETYSGPLYWKKLHPTGTIWSIVDENIFCILTKQPPSV